jgi:hypothetical protein
MNYKKIIKFFENLSFFHFLLFFSLLFSLYHSTHWIFPYLEYGDSYLPIKYGTIKYDRGGDDFFFYSYIREIVDNGILVDDPISSENKKIYSIYNTYNLSLFFGSFFSVISKNTSSIYMLNYFFFSLINFFFVGLFTNFFLKKNYQCFFVAFLVLCFSPIFNFFYSLEYVKDIFLVAFDFKNTINYVNQIYRFPTLLFTNIHLFVTAFILVRFFSSNFKKNYFLIIALILAVGASPYISVQNLVITYLMLIFLFFAYYKIVINQIFIINIFLICSLISFPGILFFLKSFFDLNIFESINFEKDLMNIIENSKQFYFFNKYYFYKELFKYLIIVLPIIFIKNNNKKIILPIIFSILLPYFFFLITYGINYSYKFMSRGGEILLTCILIIYYIKLCNKLFYEKNFYINKFFKYSFLAGIFLLISVMLVSEIKIANFKLRQKDYHDKNFYELIKWINNELLERKTFVSIDPDIYLNLPIYTNADSYMHHSVIGRSTFENRVERFIRLSKYYGISEKKILEELSTLHSDVTSKFYYIEDTIYTHDKVITKNAINNNDIKKKIVDLIKKTNSDLKFSHDYLVISAFDKELIKKKFTKESTLLVFKNADYEVYKFNNYIK